MSRRPELLGPSWGLVRAEPATDVRCVILAGGRSRRMERRKADMDLEGRSLVEWARDAAREAGLAVSVLRQDRMPGLGPLGGVLTAFSRFRAQWLLFLACDMPFLASSTLRQLIRAGIRHDTGVFFASRGRIGFPFLLPRRSAAAVEEQASSGKLSLQDLGARLGAQAIPVAPRQRLRFLNLNTPQDWERARRLVPRLGRTANGAADGAVGKACS